MWRVMTHHPTAFTAHCNGFQYATSIMTTSLRQNLVDLEQFYSDVAANQLPAVTFVKPDVLLDGHPGSSTPPLYEAFVRKIVNSVRGNDQLWKDTAILITFDESGGLYDSGYIQPIDFFGDGPRTVLMSFAIRQERSRRSHLCRSRFDSEVHRMELDSAIVVVPQPRQFAEPDCGAERSVFPA